MSINISDLNSMQQYAYNVALAGYNIFLTGDAGTGKTYTANKIKQGIEDTGRTVMCLATTGLAALGMNGETVHSMCGIGPYTDTLSKIQFKDDKLASFINADTVIVEEISMCRIDVFEVLIKYIFEANSIRKKRSKANIQVIFVGDFFQLPPVMTDNDRLAIEKVYGTGIRSGYAFQSKYWNTLDLKYIMLVGVVRQSDKEFIQRLNDVRIGNKATIQYILDNCCKQEIQDAINIYGTNKEVTIKNNNELSKIDSKLIISEARYTGDVSYRDCNIEDVLQLKVGAKVMAITNVDSDLYSYKCTNGEIGYIEYIDIVNDTVHVRFSDDKNGNRLEIIEKYTWEIYKYGTEYEGSKEKLVYKHVGDIVQFPLRLAYAITIHKSQGQTFDYVNLKPYAWDCGQIYTALSRVRKLENMYLFSDINIDNIKVSLDVIQFHNSTVGLANKYVDTTVNILDKQEKLDFDDDMNTLLGLFNNLK